jgi:hypothetical protein
MGHAHQQKDDGEVGGNEKSDAFEHGFLSYDAWLCGAALAKFSGQTLNDSMPACAAFSRAAPRRGSVGGVIAYTGSSASRTP